MVIKIAKTMEEIIDAFGAAGFSLPGWVAAKAKENAGAVSKRHSDREPKQPDQEDDAPGR